MTDSTAVTDAAETPELLEAPAPPRVMRLTRRAIEAPLGALVAGMIEGVDAPHTDDLPEDERDGAPWWEIINFDDLDRAMADIGAHIIHKTIMLQRLQSQIATLNNRQAALLAKYGQFVPAPAEGKSYKSTRGPESGGNYRNQPGRLPGIKITDEDAAAAAGYMSEKISLEVNTDVIRAADPAKLAGIELIAKPAVSYTGPKIDKGDSNA
jgi:hypothetical protein